MPWKWYDGKVIRIENHNATTKSFFVKVDSDLPFEFKAGQFVTMDLPISEKRLKRWRSYSIANAPDGSNVLEFCIVLLDGGAGTTYLFNEVEVGSNIRFKGPSGMFTLPEQEERDIVFVCTGTGVAPFKGMLDDLKKQNRIDRNIHLIFGTRHSQGILYEDELSALAVANDNFNYSVTLSREAELPEKSFEVKKGYVHQIYLKQYAIKREDLVFYLCGWSNMIDEAVDNLTNKLGYDKNQVKYELYG